MDRALLVVRVPRARGVDRHGRRRADARCIMAGHVKPLPEGRDGRGDNPLTETLVVNVRHVVGDEAIWTAGGVDIFAAELQIQHISLVTVRLLESSVRGAVRGEVVRI